MQTTTIALLITGLIIGTMSGMLGIGGAILLVPTLVLVYGFSQPAAQGTSLGALVPPIGIFAAIQYWRAGNLDLRVAGFVALGFVFGALLGATIVPHVPQVLLKRIFAGLLVYVAVQMVFANPGKKIGNVLPGLIGVAILWGSYWLRRALGWKPVEPPKKVEPEPVDEYTI
jgi:uncharacterized protein